ncbi:ubiquitin domain-containing protein 2 isoform X3 [Ornithorhynchus anatinus]|uniref:ubiquitin domain-containing protein 2 isoform X3 n=1 Tax=Ornithorhynchus anatinus TaxID=9258 RepID=UPI0010A94406|nr:ubiquitin domain-containing protein 2 isoform X3 [Ornithorhynchus anatinus]
MGGCVGAQHDSSGSLNDTSDGGGVALGRNQPLKKEKPKWKSDYPMTDGQLRSKRDEFWDTAPAFEGRKEIWDALKAAAHAFESNDHELAQAIIDGANITLPHVVRTGREQPFERAFLQFLGENRSILEMEIGQRFPTIMRARRGPLGKERVPLEESCLNSVSHFRSSAPRGQRICVLCLFYSPKFNGRTAP